MSVAGSEAMRIASTLERAGVETRRWWGDGAHAHRATAAFPRASLPATEALAASTLALPFFRDLTSQEIRRVAELTRETVDALVVD
jgi:dTDP-4-amino-4,6-dideoxygalactose transaminase